MEYFVVVDIGGTAIKYGVVNSDGHIECQHEMPTEAWNGGPSIMNRVIFAIQMFFDIYTVSGIGISTAGMVDCERGCITYASELIPDYTGMEIKKMLEDLFHVQCEVENDVNCAGLAEFYAGAAKASKVALCLTIGTGIGGSAIIDGHVFHGAFGSGCECGYMHMLGSTFQELGSAKSMVNNVSGAKSIPIDEINGKIVFEQAKSGDSDCIKAIDDLVDVLGMGIANICYILNPDTVILGGGIMAQEEYLYPRIQKSLNHYLIPELASKTHLAFAQNKNCAGMLGAYYHLIHKIKE